MLCQNCHKNEATIHVQQIVDGHIQAYHLCEECAAKQGAGSDAQDFNLAEVLFDIAGKVAETVGTHLHGENTASGEEECPACPECGWNLQQFRKTGYLGCPGCYKNFAPQVENLLKNMHRGTRHLGKIPLSAGAGQRKGHEIALLKRELEQLKKELNEKVRREEYEDAAVLRDRIEDLNRRIRENAGGS